MAAVTEVAAVSDCEWSRLTEDLIQKIASYLHANETAASLKLLNHETVKSLAMYRRIQLSQPLTPAPSWAGDKPVHVANQAWPSAAFVVHWGRPQPWRVLSLHQRRRLLCLAANSGCAASLEVALTQCGCSMTPEVAVSAVLGGSVSTCNTLLVREGCDSMARLEDVAAEAGHLELLRWLRQARRAQLLQRPSAYQMHEQAPEELATATAACRGGHAHILAWLQEEEQRQQRQRQQRPGLGGIAGVAASEPWMMDQPDAVQYLAGAAAAGGHVQLLDQLLPRLGPIPTWAALSLPWRVAQGCPLEALQRAYYLVFGTEDHPTASMKQTLVFAAACSNTPDWNEKLDWVLQLQPQGALPGHTDPVYGVLSGAKMLICGAGRLPDWLQRLQALRARNVPLPPLHELAERAAATADMAALTWLLAEQGEGVAVSDKLVCAAARAGHLPILSVLRNRGCVLSGAHVLLAAQASSMDAFHWLLAQPLKYPITDMKSVFVAMQGEGADLATLRQLHGRYGAPIDLAGVALHASVEVLDWALAALRGPGAERPEGQDVDSQLLASVKNTWVWYTAQFGNLAAADWLAQLLASHGYGGPSLPVPGTLGELGSFGALRWWLRQRQEGRGVAQHAVQEGRRAATQGPMGKLTNTEWRALLEGVASSMFRKPTYPGEWQYSRAQWNWLVSKRLEVVAQRAAAAGQERAAAAVQVEAAKLAKLAADVQAAAHRNRSAALPDPWMPVALARQVAAQVVTYYGYTVGALQ